MTQIDWTSLILGLLTFLNGFGWFFDRRRHKQEIESLKADNRLKDWDLAQRFVKDYDAILVTRLRSDVELLKARVYDLETAIQKIQDCPHWGDCPVIDELRKQQKGDESHDGDKKSDTGDKE